MKVWGVRFRFEELRVWGSDSVSYTILFGSKAIRKAAPTPRAMRGRKRASL